MTTCPKCGAVPDSDGICVSCLLAGGFGTELPTLTSGDATIDVEPSEALEYDTFANYRILRILGEGGMGAVYLAEQTEPLKRQVALKVVKLGIDSSQILSRFNYERRALALMDHPNIARVYDAGESEKGRPYFVMEFVDGLPITQYCDQHRLNTAERLELFVPVCQALQHAHQKGVIHRDIKPSNVMVTEQDGRPVPKVIDFGIAKATDQRAVENAAFTNFGQFIGTPEYMSPEQADVMTGDIDTSSDVYSLGVLLYELLIGAVPFDAQTLRKAGLSELLRIIREDEAIPMTAKLTGMGATATEVAGRRSTDPGTLRRQVTGDLNWIVMKAMEKDRQRRYPAVSELAADIRRHLDDQPVLASPPSPVYRTRKFVRRHKAGVAAAAAVLVALVAGIVGTSWQAAIASRERAEALSQRAEALRQRTDALNQRSDAVAARALAEQRSRETLTERNRAEEQTALAVRQEDVAERQRAVAEARLADVHLLADSMLFELNDDVKDLLGGTKAREALVRLGQQYLNKENAATLEDPQRRQKLAEAFIKLGELQGTPGQSNLRDMTGANESFERSVAILEPDVKKRPHDPQLRHLITLAYLRLAQLHEDGPAQYAGYKRALRSADILLAQSPGDLQGLRDRAEILDFRMKNDAWSRSSGPTEAVEIRQRILAGNPKDLALRWELARSQSILGVSLISKKSQEALDWLKKSYDGFQALRLEEPASAQYQRDCANALTRMASALEPLNRYDEAETHAREAVSILENLTAADRLNASFRLDLSFAQNILATALFDNGHIAEAIQSTVKAIAIQEEQAARFPDNPDFPRQAAAYFRKLAVYRNDAADVPGSLKEYRKAEALDRKLATRYPSRFEFSDALRLDVQGIGTAFARLGDKASELREYREAIGIARAAPSSPAVAALISTGHSLAMGLASMSRWDEAIAEQHAVVAIAESRLVGQLDNQGLQRSVSHAYRDLSNLYDPRGDAKSAIAASEKALPFLEADYASHRDDLTTGRELWSVLFYLRNQYTREGDYDRGIAAGRRSIEIAEQVTAGHLGDYSRSQYLAASLLNFAYTLRVSGRREEGLANLRRAVSVLDLHPIEKERSPVLRRDIAEDYLYIVDIFADLLREEESLPIIERTLPVLEVLARDNPGNNPYRKSLLRAYRLAASTFLHVGDLSGALDFDKRCLRLEPTPNSPRAWLGQGLLLANIGSMEMRLGRREAAQKLWRDALARFQRATGDGEKQWAADKKDLDALEMLRVSEGWAAFTLEELGDLPQALRYRESSYARAAALLKSDPGTRANRGHYEECQRIVVRAVWLAAGDHADYGPFFENGNPTPEEIQVVLAHGWSGHVGLMFGFGNPLPQRLEAAEKSVDFARKIAVAEPSAKNQVLLAESTEVSGDVFRVVAQSAAGKEKLSAYRQSRDAYAETLQILNSVKASGKLPDHKKATLVNVTIALADLDERLQAEPR